MLRKYFVAALGLLSCTVSVAQTVDTAVAAPSNEPIINWILPKPRPTA